MICGNCKRSDAAITVNHVRGCYLTAETVDQQIEILRQSLTSSPVTRAKVTEDGIYFSNDRYFKVVWNQARTSLWAKVWSPSDDRIDKGSWEYKPGAIRDLFADEKVTAMQAAGFGLLYGQCVFCSRVLTDERSIAVGYGPSCAINQGLPWGEEVAS